MAGTNKKRKVADRTKDLLMMSESKVAKRNARNAFSALESLDLVGSAIKLEKFSEAQKLAWIIAMYG